MIKAADPRMMDSEKSTSELRSLAVPGGLATYSDSGEGAPIVAVHGMPGNFRIWQALEPELAAAFRFLNVNLPGFEGTSFKAGRGYSQRHAARFVSSFAGALGLDRYVLMAHSWAGAAAIHLALQQEDIVGLVLFATVGPRVHRGWKTSPRPDKVSLLLRIPGMKTAMRGLICTTFHSIGISETTPYQELVHSVHYAGHLDFGQIKKDVRQLSQPTCLVWSEDDRVVDRAVYDEMAAACPDGPRIVLSEGGHVPQQTRAHEVAERLRPWLSAIWREADRARFQGTGDRPAG